jgi:soluble lytic murein transglycosylase-like protein
MLRAESGLNPFAERWGQGADVSFGLAQLTVDTAHGYGIAGDAYAVRTALFDRETSIRLGARHLAGCYEQAAGDWVMALRVYNGGSYGLTDDYARRYAQHIAAYERAIMWAKEVIADATQ